MADYAVTTGNVAPGSDATKETRTSGATITQGQPLYVDASNVWQLADGDGAAALRVATHLALSAGVSGQPLTAQKIVADASYTPGFTLTLGVPVILSSNVGKLAPVTDGTGSGLYLQIIGVPTSTTVLKLVASNSGVAA